MGSTYRPLTSDEMTRYWSKVDVRHGDACWNWTAYRKFDGYGMFRWLGGMKQAHRIALFCVDPNHNGLDCLHKCDNKSCCNPNHLYWGDDRQNARDWKERNPAYLEVVRQRGKWLGNVVRKKALLTSQASYIKKLVAAGYQQKQCAKWYGVSKQVVNDVIRGRTHSNA